MTNCPEEGEVNFELKQGDCREVLATLEPDSIDSVVSDPPYGLEFMGAKWDSFGEVVDDPATVGGFQDGNGGNAYSRSRIRVGHQKPMAYQEFMFEVASGLLRVMKPGAYGLMFGGTRTYHRVACALEDAGFEIRDCLGWLYGSGFPKSSNQKGDWTGFGTALKPAWEPIVMFRKPSKLTVPKNLEALGVGALNIDGCRVGDSGGTRKEKPEPGRETVNCYGSGLNGCVVASTDKGRWPANILHDGSDEVMAVFPEQKSADKRGDCEGSRPGGFANVGTDSGSGEPCGRVYDDKGSAARFFYCAKANRKDRDEGLGDSFESTLPKAPNGAENCVGSGRGSMSKPRKNSHPTVKPTALMRYLCRLVTPPGGLVLDPFNGSGSTGKAALLEGFRYLGIEQSEEYLRISEARLQAVEAR